VPQASHPLSLRRTHVEYRAIADAVKAKQQERGLLGVYHMITRLAKTNLTVSQRRDPISSVIMPTTLLSFIAA
jgi:hypothetical protein